MSSIQFNYFANAKGEEFIKKELFKKFGSIFIRTYFGEEEYIANDIKEFALEKYRENTHSIYVTSSVLVDEIHFRKYKDYCCMDDRNSPVIEYSPSFMRDDGVYIEGRLAYFAGNTFPEFKKEVQSLFRKLKRNCWRDKRWQTWVFNTIGDEATLFIPNKVVHVTKVWNV